jgi:hypothetical protein
MLALVVAATLLLAPLPRLVGYHDRAYASGENNERAYALSRRLAEVRRPGELLVLDEAFGSETGGGVSELRALRYLLAFDEVPVRVIKNTPKRLEDELVGEPSLLVILNGRQVEEFERLRLEPLTPVPRRGREVGIFRLDASNPQNSAERAAVLLTSARNLVGSANNEPGRSRGRFLGA